MIAGIVLMLAAVAVIYFGFINTDNSDIKGRIHLLKEESVVMRFKIIIPESSENEECRYVLAAKLFDLDGDVVGRFETEFDGSDIKFTFTDINISDKHLIFPESMIFDSQNKIKTLNLKSYYAYQGCPEIYRSQIIDRDLLRGICNVFALLAEKGKGKVEKKYGRVTKIEKILKNPGERTLYQLTIKSDGNITID